MKKITNDDLVLLYYGEHDDPGLAKMVAADPELSARFEALGNELGQIDSFSPPARDDNYGVDTWMKISPQLAVSHEKPAGYWSRLRAGLAQPRFSLAGVAAVAVVAVLTFMLGRQDTQPGMELPIDNKISQSTAMAQLDTERLLTSSVSGHLEQLNIVLTEFANSDHSRTNEAERATDMLVANRLYRQAAAARGDHALASFLAGLEPLLIEMAYEAHRDSPATRSRMQQEIRDSLLFRVRAVSQRLQNSTIST
ncbi:MAG: hypothetical protein V2I48_00860 [Xanthomonadales bacterium]|jgi:hypothetical protein|nr:hypothetical protein [Xanthomonadales bacterium]